MLEDTRMKGGDKKDVLFVWSGGKDSALALYKLIMAGEYSVRALLTTVTLDYDRVSMHGVRRDLLLDQAEKLAIPLRIVLISKESTNEEYEKRIAQALMEFKKAGITTVAFGDIFLEDLRKYREEHLSHLGMGALFPLWKIETRALAEEFLNLGFRAVVTCVDTEKIPKEFAGREFDIKFLSDLPAGVDPCGENGEFHSFVYDGPIFKERIPFRRGEVVMRDSRFCFCDILPLR